MAVPRRTPQEFEHYKMKKHILPIVALLFAPLAAHATITEVQHPFTSATQCGTFGGTTTTTCTLTFPATGAGHFGIVTIAVLSQVVPPTHITSITDNKGGTWIQPSTTNGSGCYYSSAGDLVGTIACGYNLTLAAGVTSITVSWDVLTNEGARFDFREYSYTGSSVSFDNAGQFTNLGTVTDPFIWASPSGLTGNNERCHCSGHQSLLRNAELHQCSLRKSERDIFLWFSRPAQLSLDYCSDV
jgi:hypothetical protein